MPFSDFVKAHGIPFKIKRGGADVKTEYGLDNIEDNKRYVGFYPGVDVRAGDLLEFPDGRAVQVYDVSPFYFGCSADFIRAYYKTKQEMEADAQHGQTVFNISAATNSVIGNYNSVSMSIPEMRSKAAAEGGPDRDELQEIISMLEKILAGQESPRKGLLSRFSGCMERNSWVTGAVASAIIGWLC